MDIKFDLRSGRILSCAVEGKLAKAEDILTVTDSLLPQDFMSMFSLGKYVVKDGEIVENKKFAMPKPGRAQ